jgi:galactokinase
LSSSAAVEMVFAVAWRTFSGWSAKPMKLALLCQQAENEYVGVSCGLMDQFASAHGVEGHALYFDTRSLEWQAVPLPAETMLVVANSGVQRSLISSAYNERRAACQQAVIILQGKLPHIQSLRDVGIQDFERHRQDLPATIRMRAEHVIFEIDRVQSALQALKENQSGLFGSLMYAGHASLRDLYQVSTPELDSLVEIASQLPGCIGARLTGAGFGGCTINLVAEASSNDFAQDLREAYFEAAGRRAEIYICQASYGAGEIN